MEDLLKNCVICRFAIEKQEVLVQSIFGFYCIIFGQPVKKEFF